MRDQVRATVHVEYQGTAITKSVVIGGQETNAVRVNRAMDHLSKKINIMVQSEQGV